MKKRLIAAALVAAMLVLIAAAAGPEALQVFSSPAALRSRILSLGPMAPLGLIVFSAVQIVLAPVPGYLVQIAGGYIFGPWWGTLYGLVGMLLGAALAFTVARRFGVVLLERLMPQRLLAGWLRLRNLSSLSAWLVILLLPVGDFCYFLAGLTALTLPRMLALTLLVRGPTVFVATLAGAQVSSVPPDALWLLIGLVVVVTALVLWQRDRIEMLVFDKLLLRIFGKRDEKDGRQNRDH